MSHIANKIIAQDKALNSIFSETRYRIDSFQREYRWQHKQIDALISDISSSFFANYSSNHTLADVERYDCYYMGPIVLCEDGSEMSVVDGQQRLTSFSLLLIYLRHLQIKHGLDKNESVYKDLKNYLFVSRGGRRTLSLDVPSREYVMKYLFELKGDIIDYSVLEKCGKDRESNENLLHCYDEICHLFPSELDNPFVLPLFIEWLLYKIVIVEIKAFNIDNAYTIFETMNDRGLSLNPTEILKAIVLSKIKDEEQSDEMNQFWKERISQIKYSAGSEGDLLFFRAWFRAQYARDISQGKVNDEKKDYELIGSQFHTWFKSHQDIMHLHKPSDFYYFVKGDFDFYSNVFINLRKWQSKEECKEKDNPFYVTACYPMAESLYYALAFAPILPIDSSEEVSEKLQLINQFVDIFINRRSLLGKSVNQSSIRRMVFEIIRKIRMLSGDVLRSILKEELSKYNCEDMLLPAKRGFSQSYAHYLLARLRYVHDREDLFGTLLRTRKQSSFILTQLIGDDDWEMYNIDGEKGIVPWSICNYCLCRRYDVALLPLTPKERIEYLVSNGYLPEMKGVYFDSFSDFIAQRLNILNRIASVEVWPAKI
ncbi:DUF262 domain-containing protein [Prevotella sp. P2-180]|uniref:DUF262 domain-containing protein n=1 Tax=Prevotella sp. P2-180 TaxID=2024224 RepID=UPI000B9740C1|nr:DUF262 domain-containing protein [Prevotella sp. P2-180]OYP62568.1 hypothetical protein CIK98_13370 [Prevotella sp. P2-180]